MPTLDDAVPLSTPSGGPNAEWGGDAALSYVSYTDAASIVQSAIVDSSAWTDATTVSRYASLQQATRDIDTYEFVGYRYFESQNLEFPRELVLGFPYNRTESGSTQWSIEHRRMQEKVQLATCFQANWILRHFDSEHQDRMAMGISRYSEGVGPTHESVSYRSGIYRLSPDALGLLQDYLAPKRCYRG